ncbi:hypothetical protein H6P81_006631 [Aristolochia fimbriata]|uniref:Uncharacterized protein n=1 Tax=Aristolochia fimbriata TaxID=158543 RepID=A0AAV7EY06_ARIFI|nr:hypothetical protein H6P81_006631 [Aristolochia fimbriata]
MLSFFYPLIHPDSAVLLSRLLRFFPPDSGASSLPTLALLPSRLWRFFCPDSGASSLPTLALLPFPTPALIPAKIIFRSRSSGNLPLCWSPWPFAAPNAQLGSRLSLLSSSAVAARLSLSSKRGERRITHYKLQGRPPQLCNGNRPRENELNFMTGLGVELLQLNLVGDDRYCLFWSVDVEKKSNSSYIQILKFWAFLPQEEEPKLVKRMKKIFSDYCEDFISRCKFKLTERELEVPMSWEIEEDDASSRKNEVEDPMMRLASFDCDE